MKNINKVAIIMIMIALTATSCMPSTRTPSGTEAGQNYSTEIEYKYTPYFSVDDLVKDSSHIFVGKYIESTDTMYNDEKESYYKYDRYYIEQIIKDESELHSPVLEGNTIQMYVPGGAISGDRYLDSENLSSGGTYLIFCIITDFAHQSMPYLSPAAVMPLVNNENKDSYILKEIDSSVDTGRFPFISSAEFISDPIASVLNSPMRAAISPSSIKIQYPVDPSDVGERIDLADIVIKVKVDSTDPIARYYLDYKDNPKVYSIDNEKVVVLKNKYGDEIPEYYATSEDLHEYEGEEIIVFLCRSNWDAVMGKWNIGLAFREGGIITQSNSNEWEIVNSIIK